MFGVWLQKKWTLEWCSLSLSLFSSLLSWIILCTFVRRVKMIYSKERNATWIFLLYSPASHLSELDFLWYPGIYFDVCLFTFQRLAFDLWSISSYWNWFRCGRFIFCIWHSTIWEWNLVEYSGQWVTNLFFINELWIRIIWFGVAEAVNGSIGIVLFFIRSRRAFIDLIFMGKIDDSPGIIEFELDHYINSWEKRVLNIFTEFSANAIFTTFSESSCIRLRKAFVAVETWKMKAANSAKHDMKFFPDQIIVNCDSHSAHSTNCDYEWNTMS